MIMDCQHVLDEYLRWVKDATLVRTIEHGEECIMTTPFLDRHNDHLELHVRSENGVVRLGDGGYTMADLRMSGFDMTTPKRERIVRTVLNGFGVMMSDDDELYVEATQKTTGQKKQYLLQAILAVNDMHTLAQESVTSIFREDVEEYLTSNGVVFTKSVKLTGKSGIHHTIDFLVPASAHRPERLIRTINNATKDKVLSSIMAFTDIRSVRDNQLRSIVVVNDEAADISGEVLHAMESYDVHPVVWSKRAAAIEEFLMN